MIQKANQKASQGISMTPATPTEIQSWDGWIYRAGAASLATDWTASDSTGAS